MSAYTLALFLTIGTVDSIQKGIATSEILTDGNSVIMVYLPIAIFPCKVREGDMFYFEYVDGVTEIRCGEPSE
jgi:hypothetical protein